MNVRIKTVSIKKKKVMAFFFMRKFFMREVEKLYPIKTVIVKRGANYSWQLSDCFKSGIRDDCEHPQPK